MTWLSRLIEWFRRRWDSKSSQIDEPNVKEQEDIREKLKVAQERASTWRNRAQMARQQNNEDLAQQALARARQYEAEAAYLQKKAPPEPKDISNDDVDRGDDPDPGIDYPGNPPWRPYDPSRVPKKPLPSSGAGEVAMPLPEDKNDL
ncbi:MAG TPA: hypothetical protein EYN91_25550 [Candidatus Melainabacteria bacterium]|jgi:hypothetical protein|nr:hypothetical protein [Candidatus Melainabacteria bacterium]HIN66920.1 hypothetical protein [Candidatus Obscuribacterales bacterium]